MARSISASQIEVAWAALPPIPERVLGYEVHCPFKMEMNFQKESKKCNDFVYQHLKFKLHFFFNHNCPLETFEKNTNVYAFGFK